MAAELEIDPAGVVALLEERPDTRLVDVREPYEWDAGRLAGSEHIELLQLSERAAELRGDAPVVFYCRTGSRSLMAAQALRAAGMEAYSMRGGLVVWVEEDRPLEPEDGHVAPH
jgi:rhodanese-related sulfurtransferase